MPCYDDCGDYVITKQPGLFPELLDDIGNSGFCVSQYQPATLWVTVDTKGAEPGTHEIKIALKSGDEVFAETSFTLEIKNCELEAQKLIYTDWFHADCLADYYNVTPFSQKHWDIVGNFMKTAAEHGMNMILTPVFTPALDTAVGYERTTTQLVDIKKEGGRYIFSFKKLKKWYKTALKNGIKYIEICPLFTQWGANNAPKIMASVDGEYKRIFGWETDAYGEEYREFLDSFLSTLIRFLTKNKFDSITYFHISDEPSLDAIEKYKAASEMINKHLGGNFKVIDALSSYEFYRTGLIDIPVPSTNHIEPFVQNGVETLWCYYCCGQYEGALANRFFNMPSLRNRIIGVQMYKYNVKGFLHWGYNFWNSLLSYKKINPYYVTDCEECYPSGDAYVVYPKADGTALCSLRFEVFFDAIQDYTALKTLESKLGREKVLEIIAEFLGENLSFTEYPHDENALLELREKINSMAD